MKNRPTAIDTAKRTVRFDDGTSQRYQAFISTTPLDILIRLCGLEALQKHAQNLHYSTPHIVGIGLADQRPQNLVKRCWMYFPEDNARFTG